MADSYTNAVTAPGKIRHRGRLDQIRIYLGKFIRMFVYQNEWKVFPMAVLIAGLVSMVVRRDFFVTMEGTLKGSFALTCVAIWNGCFNSIQVICRERNIIKREHRSGLHISSYIVSHMLYQALLCIAQTFLTLYVCRLMGVKFPKQGFITPWFPLDIGITVFLISYASDMLSLWISALSHSTTTAMTVMPFILIFQLVFSGGIFNLPAWTSGFSRLTISNYGLKCIAAQSDYNNLPMVSVWNNIVKLSDTEVGGTVTVGQVLDFLSDDSNGTVRELRQREIGGTYTVGELYGLLQDTESYKEFRKREFDLSITVGEVLDIMKTNSAFSSFRERGNSLFTMADLLNLISEFASVTGIEDKTIGRTFTAGELLDRLKFDELAVAMQNVELDGKMTVGSLIDMMVSNPDVQALRDREITVKVTLGKLIDMAGEQRVKAFIEQKTADAARVEAYERTTENITDYWLNFFNFIVLFAALAVITLEFIDKDKR